MLPAQGGIGGGLVGSCVEFGRGAGEERSGIGMGMGWVDMIETQCPERVAQQ